MVLKGSAQLLRGFGTARLHRNKQLGSCHCQIGKRCRVLRLEQSALAVVYSVDWTMKAVSAGDLVVFVVGRSSNVAVK